MISVVPLRVASNSCVHSVASHFALWLDYSLPFGALKLFDEVLVKQIAAKVHVR